MRDADRERKTLCFGKVLDVAGLNMYSCKEASVVWCSLREVSSEERFRSAHNDFSAVNVSPQCVAHKDLALELRGLMSTSSRDHVRQRAVRTRKET